MEQQEPKPDHTGTRDSARVARDAAQRLKDEAEKALKELKNDGGFSSFFEFEKMYFPSFACALFKVFCVLMAILLLAGTVSSFVSMAEFGLWHGITNLLKAWGGVAFMVILARVWIERALVTFSIKERVDEIARRLETTKQ